MDIVEKKNALVVPQTLNNDFGRGKERFAHGVVRDEHDPVYFSHLRAGRALLNEALRAPLLTKQPEKLAGRWLYLGGLHHHFGHFISECIHRAWAWSQYRESCCGVLILPHHSKKWQLPTYAKDIFSLFGVQEAHIHYVTQLTEVESLLIPEPGSQLGYPPAKQYIDFLKTLPLDTFLADCLLPDEFAIKIFVSRKSYRAIRSVAGLDALDPILKQQGYFIFHPENYSVLTQLKVYRTATKIIFEEGSAVHLLELLGHINADVLLINRRADSKLFDHVISPRANSYIKYDDIIELPYLMPARHLHGSANANSLAITNAQNLLNVLISYQFVSDTMQLDADWLDRAKLDMFNYLLKCEKLVTNEFNAGLFDYLHEINDFLKALNTDN